jgi:peptidyl-prolyl cis-trans isomerase B (cyclophilin B)
VVYKRTPLPPSYAVFGHLDAASVKVVKDVAAAGTADGGPDGPPKQDVTIQSVTIDD